MTVRAVLFDYGGTLDGPGQHWLNRFDTLYQAVGLALPFPRLRHAFDAATQRAYRHAPMRGYGLADTVAFHVRQQFTALGLDAPQCEARIVSTFIEDSRHALRASRALLTQLHPHVQLGVISNFYGNVERLLHEADIAPLLAVIADSTLVGVRKPDRRIFDYTLARLSCPVAAVWYVGDSFEKDIRSAHAVGLHTAWMQPPGTHCPAPEMVDMTLQRLEDITTLLA